MWYYHYYHHLDLDHHRYHYHDCNLYHYCFIIIIIIIVIFISYCNMVSLLWFRVEINELIIPSMHPSNDLPITNLSNFNPGKSCRKKLKATLHHVGQRFHHDNLCDIVVTYHVSLGVSVMCNRWEPLLSLFSFDGATQTCGLSPHPSWRTLVGLSGLVWPAPVTTWYFIIN